MADKKRKLDDEAGKKAVEDWSVVSKPGEKHKILEQLVGKFKCETTFFWGESPQVGDAVAEGSAFFGGRFIQLNYEQEMPNYGDFSGRATLSYDNMRKKFQSVWADSMATAQYLEEGTDDVDANGVVSISLKSVAPHPDASKGGKLKTSRSAYHFRSNDEIFFEMFSTPEGGEEKLEMTITYTRQK